MRVLVVGTSKGGAEDVETALEDAGHEVVRCHEAGERAFPCADLIEGRACPFDAGPVDVAVTVRDRPWPHPVPLEDGAICALRRYVPLVRFGSAFDPFGGREACSVDDPALLVAACEEVVERPLQPHSERATQAARETIAHAGHPSD